MGAAMFAFVVATAIIPAGARFVGMAVGMVGEAIYSHGERLSAAYRAYRTNGKV